MSFPWRWALAFAFTHAVELPFYFRATRSFRVSFLASTLTHPVAWFVFPRLVGVGLSWLQMAVLAELFAVVVEGIWLRHHRTPRAFAWSLAANAASVSLGLLSRELVGLPSRAAPRLKVGRRPPRGGWPRARRRCRWAARA